MISKPLPVVGAHNAPYFEGTKEGRLSIQRCSRCESYVFFPREVCPGCLSSAGLEWTAASGRGSVYSFCIVHRPQNRAFDVEVPIIFGAIEMQEGPVMLAEIRGIEPDQVAIGLAVQVDFTVLNYEVALPVWKPVQSRGLSAAR